MIRLIRSPQIDIASPGTARDRFGQRQHRREQVAGRVALIRRGHTPEAHRRRICWLSLCDMSTAGLAATCDTPLLADEPVTLYLDADAPTAGFEVHGHVVRCEPRRRQRRRARGDGYHVAIHFDPLNAA